MNLSDKIELIRTFPKRIEKLDMENVKEAVRLLKEDCCECEFNLNGKLLNQCDVCYSIDKIFGDKLI